MIVFDASYEKYWYFELIMKKIIYIKFWAF